jgi:sugar O-acyltransferase (sialic acid O-acetyltransferase NeuD family)
MTILLIYGCGGHARSVGDVALDLSHSQLIFIDSNAKLDEKVLGFPVYETHPELHEGFYFVAIGDNHKRAAKINELLPNNPKLVTLSARSAYRGREVAIAQGVFVGHAAHLGPRVQVGLGSIINTRAVVEHDGLIGKHCHISVNATLAGKVKIGDFVMVGAGATIINNITICSDVTIGAGALVVKNITEPGTYMGVPAVKKF